MGVTRKYALIRLDKGRYLLPSNDGRTMNLIERYWEDGSLQRQRPNGSWRSVVGEFWMASATPMDAMKAAAWKADDVEDAVAECRWECVLGPVTTRQEAIDYVIGEDDDDT